MKEQKGYNPHPVILPLFLPCTPAEQPALSSPGQTSPLLVFPEKLSHQELDLLDASLSLAALGQRGRRRGHFQLTGPRPATGAALWSLFSCPSRGALRVTVEGVCVCRREALGAWTSKQTLRHVPYLAAQVFFRL